MARKGQTEIIGIAIIVLILIVGAIFALAFLKPKPADRSAEHKQRANAFLNVLLSEKLDVTSFNCKKGVELRDLFADCAIPDADPSHNKCGGAPGAKTYCEKGIELANEILQKTYVKEKVKHYLYYKLSTSPTAIKPISGNGCSASKSQDQVSYHIPTSSAVTVSLTMVICD